jgi:septum formation protein
MRRNPRRARSRCSSATWAERLRLILASRSPQRRAILEQLGVAFEVAPSDAPELTDGPPHEVALENAYRKAAAVAAVVRSAPPAPTVLGADTVVSLGSRVYGKPRDAAHATEMLGDLAGGSHVVVSGLCVISHGEARTAAASTTVELRALDSDAIDRYVDTGEWRGRAGGYAIQGRGAALVRAIQGDYLGVVGLPASTLLDLIPGLLREG